MTRPVRLAAIAALACASACDYLTTPPEPASGFTTAIRQAALANLDARGGARFISGVPSVFVPPFYPADCPYVASDQSFTCPTAAGFGNVLKVRFYLYDGSGRALTTIDEKVVASARTVTDFTGSLTASGLSKFGMAQHSDMTVSGLLTSTTTMSGTSHENDTLAVTSGLLTITTIQDATAITDRVTTATGATYPASGTITTDTQGLVVSSGPFSVHSTLTFNGTSMVPMLMTVGSLNQTCQVDLSMRLPPACRNN